MRPCHDATLTALVGALYDAMACRTAHRLVFSQVRVGNVIVEGEIAMFMVPVDKTAAARISVVDSFGNPAQIDGAASWSLSDPTGLELIVDPDGFGASLRSMDGALRTVQLQVSVDADLGSGVTPLSAVADVQFVAGTASAIAIDLSVP